MPYEQPGLVHEAVATKQVVHGDPAVEDGFAGIAAKTIEPSRWTNPSNAGRRVIPITEPFEIMLVGIHPIPQASFPGGVMPAVGDKVWIRDVDNAVLNGDQAEGTDEIQIETVTATGGTETLTIDGETTAAFAFNANAAARQAALEGLSNVSPGDIVVTGTGPFTYTFGGRYGDQDVPTIVVNTGSLTGGTSSFATPTPGVARTVHKLGLVERIEAATSRAFVNFDQRGSF